MLYFASITPWWSGGRFPDLPKWRRAAFREISAWMENPPAGRALLLSGARQVGKTTLYLQAIEELLNRSFPPTNILYATFDHPLLKLIGLDALLKLWRKFEPAREGPEYLFLDEIQVAKDWQTWLRHQVDFEKRRRIGVTGSATPLVSAGQESGVGRWQTIRLATLSFFEYLQIRRINTPPLPAVESLLELFAWNKAQFARCGEDGRPLPRHSGQSSARIDVIEETNRSPTQKAFPAMDPLTDSTSSNGVSGLPQRSASGNG